MKKTPKVVIVGLDAAVQTLLMPWMQEGKLPHLAKLCQAGASGLLESVIQPLTPAAWTTFMTGKNCGKHGIYNFMEPSPDGYGMAYTNGGSRKGDSIWRILNRAGLSVGVMNTPFTFPPEKVDGFQISGFDTPSSESAFVHPPELKKELEDKFGKMHLDSRYLGAMTSLKKRAEALDALKTSDDQWLEMALYLIENHPQDVMMFTFMSIDTVQHHFWHYMDASHHLHDPEGAELFRDAILQVYQRLDQATGKILSRLDLKKTCVFCVSDHGQEGVSDRTLHVNRILAQAGLLYYKPPQAWRSMITGCARPFLNLLRKTLTSRQKMLLASVFPQMRDKADALVTSYNEIDWSRTLAYANESLSSPPCVSINLKGVKPSGIVEKERYDEVVKRVCAALDAVKDPRTGQSVVGRIFHRDEIYFGPYAYRAPDLTLQWWGDRQFNAKPSLRQDQDLPPLTIDEPQPMRLPEWSGHHTLHGIIIAAGPEIKSGSTCEGARLVDMAPTLLYLLNLPIPDDMDGQVIAALFEPAWDEKKISYRHGAGVTEVPNAAYSEEEAVLVEERLKNLGYLE